MEEDKADAVLPDNLGHMFNLMGVEILHGHGRFLTSFLCLKINIVALVNARIVSCRSLSEIGFYNFCPTSFWIVNLDNLNRSRLLVNDSQFVGQIVIIGLVDGRLERHSPIGKISFFLLLSDFWEWLTNKVMWIVNHNSPNLDRLISISHPIIP